MPLPAKMHVLKGEIRCHQQFMVGSQTQDGRVVSDAGDDPCPTRAQGTGDRPAPNSLDQFSLAFRHGITIPLDSIRPAKRAGSFAFWPKTASDARSRVKRFLGHQVTWPVR